MEHALELPQSTARAQKHYSAKCMKIPHPNVRNLLLDFQLRAFREGNGAALFFVRDYYRELIRRIKYGR